MNNSTAFIPIPEEVFSEIEDETLRELEGYVISCYLQIPVNATTIIILIWSYSIDTKSFHF